MQLIETFQTPQAVFRASRSELEAAGIASGLAQSIASGCAFDDAVTQQQKLAEAGAVLIPFTDSRYPARLKDIFDPPPLLFARGRVDLLEELMIGDRRNPPPDGLRDDGGGPPGQGSGVRGADHRQRNGPRHRYGGAPGGARRRAAGHHRRLRLRRRRGLSRRRIASWRNRSPRTG